MYKAQRIISTWRSRLRGSRGLVVAFSAVIGSIALVTAPGETSANASVSLVDGAINWAQAFVGHGDQFNGLCFTFVYDAYLDGAGINIGTPPYPYGAVDWWNAHRTGQHPGDINPPKGALVFWGATSANSFGHVGISLGSGQVISSASFPKTTSDPNAVHVFSIAARTGGGSPYLGWISPPGVNLSTEGEIFIKTKHTGSGKVELFEIPGPNYQKQPTVATPTWFSPGDANNGWFQMDGSTLVFIKTKHTGSGKVELFEIPGPNYQKQPTVATPTWFSPGDANNGWFQMDGSTLVFIKTKHTGSGKVELFEIPGPNYQKQPTVATPTWFSPGDANNGWFQMDGSTLVFIKTKHTGSGKVELFEIPGPNYQKQPTVATPTWFSPGDANNGWFQMDGSTLVFIKTKHTGSGKVELFEIPGPNYQKQPTVATPTWFSPGDANNGWFQMDGK